MINNLLTRKAFVYFQWQIRSNSLFIETLHAFSILYSTPFENLYFVYQFFIQPFLIVVLSEITKIIVSVHITSSLNCENM